MECTRLATGHCGDWQHQGGISPAMPKTRQQQSFCDTCQASMSCWFPPLPLPHARNGSSPISQLQARLMPEAAPAPPSLVCAALLCSDLLCQSEKCYNISCWNGWSPSTPEHGDFAQRSASAWHQQWLMGTLQSWAFKGFVLPWEGPIFAKPGPILLFCHNPMCRKLSKSKRKSWRF